jgi:hypothetical protein
MSIRTWWIPVGMSILLAAQAASAAAPVEQRGIATIPFSGKTPAIADYRNAERAAEVNAIARYIASTTSAEERNFQKMQSSVTSSLSQYVLGVTPISKSINADLSTLTMVVRVDLDTNALTNAFRAHSAVHATASSARSYIAFIFVARQQAAITRYGPEVSALNASQETENGVNNVGKAATGAIFADEHAAIKRTKLQSSETQRAATIKYRVASSGTVNSAMTGVFADEGYQVAPIQYLASASHNQINLKAFRAEYARGNDISSQTLTNALAAAQKLQIRYIAVGTLDTGIAGVDPQSGLQRVFVTVTGTLYYLGGLFPQTLVAVGPVQYSGLGPTESTAQTNALRLAAKAAAHKMAQAMAAAQVH